MNCGIITFENIKMKKKKIAVVNKINYCKIAKVIDMCRLFNFICDIVLIMTNIGDVIVQFKNNMFWCFFLQLIVIIVNNNTWFVYIQLIPMLVSYYINM